eukprot:5953835-Prymnesium_polylepis.1
MEKQHAKELRAVRKELRADAAQQRVEYEGAERAARVALEEQLHRVRNENTELERKLRAAERAARLSRQDAAASEEEAAAEKAAAEAEVARVKEHGRAWARARDEAARRASVEAERDQLLERVQELEAKVSSRSQGRAAEHQELLCARAH